MHVSAVVSIWQNQLLPWDYLARLAVTGTSGPLAPENQLFKGLIQFKEA
jgi:hypothetical protein